LSIGLLGQGVALRADDAADNVQQGAALGVELVDLLAGGQGFFNVVPLSGVVNELAADIVRIERPTSGQVVDGARPARAAGE